MGVEKRDVEIKATRNDAGTQTANQLIASDWKVAGFEYSPATHITVHFWREIPDSPNGKSRVDIRIPHHDPDNDEG